jgi:caffeoyl-CoA O-methyltransferase
LRYYCYYHYYCYCKHCINYSEYKDKIQIRAGPAMDTIAALAAEQSGAAAAATAQYDLVFLDGDKRNYTEYYERILELQLLAPGALILADNVLFKGLVPSVWSSAASDSDSGSEGEGTAASSTKLDKQERRRLRIADALHAFNAHVQADARTAGVLLPIRDGLTMVQLRA